MAHRNLRTIGVRTTINGCMYLHHVYCQLTLFMFRYSKLLYTLGWYTFQPALPNVMNRIILCTFLCCHFLLKSVTVELVVVIVLVTSAFSMSKFFVITTILAVLQQSEISKLSLAAHCLSTTVH